MGDVKVSQAARDLLAEVLNAPADMTAVIRSGAIDHLEGTSQALAAIARFEAQAQAELVEALRANVAALDGAYRTFMRYAEMHMAKGTADGAEKAQRNLDEANAVWESLANARLLLARIDGAAS